MDLNKILEKTKEKSIKNKTIRSPVYIATSERPYDPPKEKKQTEISHEKSDNKLASKVTTEVTTNYQQTTNKLLTNYQQSDNKLASKVTFSSLFGLQRKIVDLIYNECTRSRSKVTEPITIEYVCSNVGATKKTVKTSIYRLEKKGIILRSEFKNGRGGWTRYELKKDIFHELLQQTTNKVTTNHQQSDNKLASKLTSELTSLSPSSSSYINTTTTNPEELPDNWLEINITEANQFGLTRSHLVQLYKAGKHEPEMIERSIQHFVFDLEHNNKKKDIKTNPLSYFIGILRNIGFYAAPDNYESHQDRAMRLYLEKQKAIEAKRVAMEKELLDIELQKWLNNLDDKERDKLIPSSAKKMNLVGPKVAALHSYFTQNIWPDKKRELVKKICSEV